MRALRMLADQNRSDAELLTRRTWWMRLLGIRPSDHLARDLIANAEEFERRIQIITGGSGADRI